MFHGNIFAFMMNSCSTKISSVEWRYWALAARQRGKIASGKGAFYVHFVWIEFDEQHLLLPPCVISHAWCVEIFFAARSPFDLIFICWNRVDINVLSDFANIFFLEFLSLCPSAYVLFHIFGLCVPPATSLWLFHPLSFYYSALVLWLSKFCSCCCWKV